MLHLGLLWCYKVRWYLTTLMPRGCTILSILELFVLVSVPLEIGHSNFYEAKPRLNMPFFSSFFFFFSSCSFSFKGQVEKPLELFTLTSFPFHLGSPNFVWRLTIVFLGVGGYLTHPAHLVPCAFRTLRINFLVLFALVFIPLHLGPPNFVCRLTIVFLGGEGGTWRTLRIHDPAH